MMRDYDDLLDIIRSKDSVRLLRDKIRTENFFREVNSGDVNSYRDRNSILSDLSRKHKVSQDIIDDAYAKVSVSGRDSEEEFVKSAQENYSVSRPIARKIFSDVLAYSGEKIGFPWNIPSRTSTSAKTTLFDPVITDTKLDELYDRNPVAKRIVDSLPELGFMNGLKVKTPEGDDVTARFDNFMMRYRADIIDGFKLARLHGIALIYIDMTDKGPRSEKPVIKSDTKFRDLTIIRKTWIDEIVPVKDEKTGKEQFPRRIHGYRLTDDFTVERSKDNLIHADRIIAIRNHGLQLLKEGKSVLNPTFDSLTVFKHITWGAGQAFWRSGNNLLTIAAPPRSTSSTLEDINNAVKDIDARTTLVFPYGTNIDVHKPAGLDPEKYQRSMYSEVSTATNIPAAHLMGTRSGEAASATEDTNRLFATVKAWQQDHATPVMTKLLNLIVKLKEVDYRGECVVEFNHPHYLAPTEQTIEEWNRIRNLRAKFQMGAMSPDEVRKETVGREPLTPEEKAEVALLLKRTYL